jgi:hypothetical protein
MKNIEEFASNKFIANIEDFFNGLPSKRNGLPTVSLLLFLDPNDWHYVWKTLDIHESIAKAVIHGMSVKYLIPVGATQLTFEKRDTGRIHLSKAPCRLDERFDREEVLNATIPYFMRDAFGHKLESIKFTDFNKH